MSRKIYGFFVLLVGILALITGGAYFKLHQFPQTPLNKISSPLLTIPKGTNATQLAQLLEKEQVLSNAHLLPWFLRVHPELSYIKAGTYSLEKVQTLGELLTQLNVGKGVELKVRFLEGTTFSQWRKILKQAPHLQQQLVDKSEAEIYALLDLPKENPPYLEGWFYPDTYHYPFDSSDVDLLKRSSSRLQKDLAQAWQEREDDLPLKTPYEMLILASIVQKETHLAKEQPLVASVFINRLRQGMRLQTDPTVIYGMGERYQGNITKKDLLMPTPYNTYTIDGLPPTPIAMVTKTALDAVAHPAKSRYLFFVADGRGGHKFSETLTEHNKAVQAYLHWYRENIKGKNNAKR